MFLNEKKIQMVAILDNGAGKERGIVFFFFFPLSDSSPSPKELPPSHFLSGKTIYGETQAS